jgi:phage tail sheath protein FI
MLKTSTQWAVFQNNDVRLWSQLRNTAQNILQPIWEAGGLAGSTAADAYYIVCDGTINTPQVIQSGEVRMQVGVALQYPAEFVVIRISQFDSGASVTEVTAA